MTANFSYVKQSAAAHDPALHGLAAGPEVNRLDQRLLGLLLLLSGALPSLLWLIIGPDLFTDDFGHTLVFRQEGLIGGALDRSFESTGRPLVGFYYLLTYGVIGDNPKLHALVMVVLNGALVMAVWRLGRRVLPANSAYLAALLLAVVPNRASTRLWFATGNYVLATILVLVGLALLIVWARPVSAALILTIGMLLFEGTAGLVAAGISLWMLGNPKARFRTAVLVATPSAMAAAGMYLASPKRSSDGPTWNDSLRTIGPGLLGEGLWGPVLGTVGSVALVALAVVGGVLLLPPLRHILPSFRRMDDHLRTVLFGTVITLLGAAPFVVGGSPFATQGIFDRTNLIPLVGVCLIIAGAIDALSGRLRKVACGSALLILVVFGAQNAADIADYRDAAATGREIVHSVEVMPPVTGNLVVVVPSPPDDRGIAAFVFPADLDQAISLRVPNQQATVLLPQTPTDCRELLTEDRATIFDWREQRVLPPVPSSCEP